jgi:hypothetical protein
MTVPVGTLKLATVSKYNPKLGLLEVVLDLSGLKQPKKINIPFSLYSFNGLFIGGIPEPGTTVVVGQGEGEWYFVSFLMKDTSRLPDLKSGEILLQASSNTSIKINRDSTINIGSYLNKIYINTDRNIIIDNFNNKLSFTEASREITGIVLRDKSPNENISKESRLDNPNYDKYLKPIGLDPKFPVNSVDRGSIKNPAFVEKRELIYEFAGTTTIEDELFESSLYGSTNENKKTYLLPNRRKNRTDTLSLSLVSPNYLIETVKGTVVDIFGNILDLNRQPIPIGNNNITLNPSGEADKVKVYLKIRELQRKSIAYHFEINARKNLIGPSGIQLPDINSNADYSRNRSRFFLDIDKEGQFKLNVPASSENGNIPLLVRYENYSTYGPQDDGNVNKHYFRKDGKDIFVDSFANSEKSTINITGNKGVNDSGTTMAGIIIEDEDGNVAPTDRIIKIGDNEQTIRHNTPYHNILDTCYASHTSQANKYISYQYEPSFDVSSIPTIDNIVTPVIKVSGKDANAGGRSGSINFDGSLEMSIGANTIDRQSLWLDTAGGILANIGRDRNNISAAVSMDGDLILQVGGMGISSDSRFKTKGFNNGWRPGAIDIRVFNAGFDCTLVRIDNEGIKISTPGRMIFHSQGQMTFRSQDSIHLDADHIIMHSGDPLQSPVLKDGRSK